MTSVFLSITGKLRIFFQFPITNSLGTDKDAEIGGSDFHIVIPCPGIPVDCGKPVAEYLHVV